MTERLGLIISKSHHPCLLEDVRKKYGLGLIEIDNEYVNRQLLDDEVFLQATWHGSDSESGIGAYEIYIMDPSELDLTIDDLDVRKLIKEDFLKRREGYKKDALQWIEILTLLKCELKIDKVGLFWHRCTTSFDKEKIDFVKRIDRNISEVDMEYMMKISPDVIVFLKHDCK